MTKQQKMKKKEKIHKNLNNNTTQNKSKKNIQYYFNTHKTELLRSTIILLILIIIYLSSTTIVNLRSSYAEQIMMETNPQYINIETRQDQEKEIIIETEIRTNIFCKTKCEYKLMDLSEGEITNEGTFSFSNYKKHLYITNISTNKLGSGQKLYLFEISCTNQDSRMCESTKIPILRTSLITLNYEPSIKQQLEKEELQIIINDIAQTINEGDTNTLIANEKIKNINSMKKNHLDEELNRIKFFRNIIKKDLEKINEEWQTQNYTNIRQELKTYHLIDKSSSLKEQSQILLQKIEQEQQTYNLAIQTLTESKKELESLNEIQKALLLMNQTIENITSNLYTKNIKLLYELNKEEFKNYEELKPLITDIENTTKEINYTLILNENNSYAEVITWLNILKNDLCLLQEENCTQKIIHDELENTSLELNITNREQIINYTQHLCEEINELNEKKQELTNQKQILRMNLTEQQIIEIDEEKNKVEQSMIQWQIRQLNTNQTKARYKLLNYSQNLNQTISINYYPNHHDLEKKEYFMPAKYLTNDTEKYIKICSLTTQELPEINKEKELIQEFNIIAPPITITEEVSATCCFKSICKPCCDYYDCKIEHKNPLIVLHGYSFYSFNSALHSTNAFNDFIKHMMEDDNYYPVGIIGPSFYPQYEPNDLTRNFATPIFKATYYDIIKFGEINPGELNLRTQSITEHATKLNELVEHVKNITGKDQVDIVAHSMGGLVTRAYIEEYGENSLGKIILVGTPNQGVPSRLVYLCRFFGGQTECDDMYQNSTFMNYINIEAKQPEKEIHMLVGTGCNTFGANGDGIVTVDSAELNFTKNYYFEGTCGPVGGFHRDMIKPTMNYEIYEKIKELLNT